MTLVFYYLKSLSKFKSGEIFIHLADDKPSSAEEANFMYGAKILNIKDIKKIEC